MTGQSISLKRFDTVKKILFYGLLACLAFCAYRLCVGLLEYRVKCERH